MSIMTVHNGHVLSDQKECNFTHTLCQLTAELLGKDPNHTDVRIIEATSAGAGLVNGQLEANEQPLGASRIQNTSASHSGDEQAA
jgi:hypothetical protein